MNPGRGYVDPYAFSRGNPFLNPQYTHALELKHGFDNKIFTSLGADFISDQIMFLIHAVDSEKAEYTPGKRWSFAGLQLQFKFSNHHLEGLDLSVQYNGFIQSNPN
ncbi:hypothetical protein BH23BAC1_BH23BAC1_04320 [soil metagenome]